MNYLFSYADLLRRIETASGDVPGRVKVVFNKGADQADIVNPNNIDGVCHLEAYLYNSTGGSTAIGNTWIISGVSGDPATSPAVITPTAVATTQRCLAIATGTILTHTFGWFAVGGWYDSVLVDGTTDVAKGDCLKSAPGTSATALITEGVTAETINTLAWAGAAQTANSAVATRCYLIGGAKVINT